MQADLLPYWSHMACDARQDHLESRHFFLIFFNELANFLINSVISTRCAINKHRQKKNYYFYENSTYSGHKTTSHFKVQFHVASKIQFVYGHNLFCIMVYGIICGLNRHCDVKLTLSNCYKYHDIYDLEICFPLKAVMKIASVSTAKM